MFLGTSQSGYCETQLLESTEEGKIVFKVLQKLYTDDEFHTLRQSMMAISKVDPNTAYPNLLFYNRNAPTKLNDKVVLFR